MHEKFMCQTGFSMEIIQLLADFFRNPDGNVCYMRLHYLMMSGKCLLNDLHIRMLIINFSYFENVMSIYILILQRITLRINFENVPPRFHFRMSLKFHCESVNTFLGDISLSLHTYIISWKKKSDYTTHLNGFMSFSFNLKSCGKRVFGTEPCIPAILERMRTAYWRLRVKITDLFRCCDSECTGVVTGQHQPI